MFRSLSRRALGACCLALLAGPAAASPVTTGALYETFGAGGIAGLTLTTPPAPLGALTDTATSVVAAGNAVYFLSGSQVLSTGLGLTGLSLVASPPAAPTAIAVDAAAGILYETFGANGVAAVELANPSQGVGNLNLAASNIAFAGNNVYFQSGNTIYRASPTLTDLTQVLTTPGTPTGFAVDAADGILYEAFGADGAAAINLNNLSQGIGALNVDATAIAYGDNAVFLTSGATIYQSSIDLVGLNTFHVNGADPVGLAILSPTAPPAVPEPASAAILSAGLLSLALRRRTGREIAAIQRRHYIQLCPRGNGRSERGR